MSKKVEVYPLSLFVTKRDYDTLSKCAAVKSANALARLDYANSVNTPSTVAYDAIVSFCADQRHILDLPLKRSKTAQNRKESP